ncbi:MAG: hypothetical protein RR256_02625 [Bacteroidales bacterium]
MKNCIVLIIQSCTLCSKKACFKYGTLLLALFIFPYFSEAKIINTVKIQVQDFQKDTARFVFNGTYLLHITQTLRFEDNIDDTIKLSLKKTTRMSVLNSICFQDIKLKTMEGNPIDYQYNSNNLSFVLPKGCKQIDLDFLFQSDYVTVGANPEIIGVSSFIQDHDQSWRFTSPDMYTDSITAIIPQNLYFFPNCPFHKLNDSVYTATLKDSLAAISFYLYDKYYYIEHSFSVDEIEVNLYLFKGVKLEDISDEEYLLMDVKDIYLVQNWTNEDRIHKVENSVRFIAERLPLIFPKRECKWEIIESLMGISFGTGPLRWATCLALSPSHAVLLIDTADYESKMLLHEITHLYNNIPPSKDDSAYFFFHEALTDYIARFLLYTDEKERDSAFMSLKEEYNKDTLKGELSIFKVKKIDANAEGGTYKIAFQKVPFLIHCFAKEIGEERFVKILSEFFQHISKTKEVNMDVLKKFCKKNGVTNKQWDKFVRQL